MPFELTRAFCGFFGSSVGAVVMFLAQFSPKEAEGWMSLGGFGLCLVGLVYALLHQSKKLDQRDALIGKLVEDHKSEFKAERLRWEEKYEAQFKETLVQREKDRDSRDKLADAVGKFADAVKNLPT